MYNVFLDDLRFPQEVFAYTNDSSYSELEWNICRDFEVFKKLITEKHSSGESINLISFDNDLGFINNDPTQELRGVDCAKWLIDFCLDNNMKFPNYKVHSKNPVAKEHIIGMIESFKKFKKNNE